MDILAIISAKYLYVLSLAIAAAWWLSAEPNVRKRSAIFAAIALPLIYVLARILGFFFYNPRPFVEGGFTPLISHAADNGFPSDHTLLVAALASVMLFFDRNIAILLWIITVIVAWGRVYTGVHHVADVVGSMVISLIVAGVIYLSGKNKNI